MLQIYSKELSLTSRFWTTESFNKFEVLKIFLENFKLKWCNFPNLEQLFLKIRAQRWTFFEQNNQNHRCKAH